MPNPPHTVLKPTDAMELAEQIAGMEPPPQHTNSWMLGFCRARKMAADLVRAARPEPQQDVVAIIEQVTGRKVEYENDELTVAQVRKVVAALALQVPELPHSKYWRGKVELEASLLKLKGECGNG